MRGFMNNLQYMSHALQLAEQGRLTVTPNPMVGCVIVKNGQIIGTGFHKQAGLAHAEVIALQQAGDQAKAATAYVSLEPCCHHGRTPPCVEAIIQAGIKKVYAACLDPNPLVSGKGIQALQAAGIETEVGLCETEAIRLNEIFFHYMRHQQPFVIAKWAMSLDGKTITHPQDTRNISCEDARLASHQIRQQVDAIVIGAKTALQDDPLLTVRITPAPNKQPLRIVLSSRGELPLSLKIFDATLPGKTLVVTTDAISNTQLQAFQQNNIETLILPKNPNGQIDLSSFLIALGKRGVTSLLVEGGMTLRENFFQENLVNKIHVYLAPIIIGGLKQKQVINHINIAQIDRDFYFTADYKVNPHV